MTDIELVDHQTEELLFKYSSVENLVPAIGEFIEVNEKEHYKVEHVTHQVRNAVYPKRSRLPAPYCHRILLHVKPL